jgi:Tol biopolymer transport system component
MTASALRAYAPRVMLALSVALIAGAAATLPAAAAYRVPGPTSAGAARLAYVRDDHVWTIGADGRGAGQLSKGTSEDSIPTWSPDGRTVAFARNGSSGLNATVRTVPAGGGTPVLLYRSSIPKAVYLAITGLAYTPDGQQLTFAESWATGAGGDIGRCRVVSLDLATRKTAVLLSRNGGFGKVIGADWQISWSPDGSTLAIAQSGQDSEGGQTWLFRPSDGDLHRLGKNGASFADWSPDGDALLLTTFTQPRSYIELVSTSGKVLRTLAEGGGWTGAPSVYGAQFSRAGSTVAYTLGPRSGKSQVWLMSAAGTGKHKLTTGSSPAWR